MSEKRDHTMDHERCCDDVSESKRTPGPWHVVDLRRHINGIVRVMGPVSDVANVLGRKQNAYEDAAFIVLACNAHDELVQALRYFIEADKEEHGSTFCLACAKARAVLAKIEGEKK